MNCPTFYFVPVRLLLGETIEVDAVPRLSKGFGKVSKLFLGDEALLVSGRFWTPNDDTGTVLYGAHVASCIFERLDRACVEPSVTFGKGGDLELTLTKVLFVDRGDFQFATLTWLNILGNINHVVIVEVETDDSEI